MTFIYILLQLLSVSIHKLKLIWVLDSGTEQMVVHRTYLLFFILMMHSMQIRIYRYNQYTKEEEVTEVELSVLPSVLTCSQKEDEAAELQFRVWSLTLCVWAPEEQVWHYKGPPGPSRAPQGRAGPIVQRALGCLTLVIWWWNGWWLWRTWTLLVLHMWVFSSRMMIGWQ